MSVSEQINQFIANNGGNERDALNVALARLEIASELLQDYNQWEADIINEDELWWPNRAEDVMRGKIYDTMLELQARRNNFFDTLK